MQHTFLGEEETSCFHNVGRPEWPILRHSSFVSHKWPGWKFDIDLDQGLLNHFCIDNNMQDSPKQLLTTCMPIREAVCFHEICVSRKNLLVKVWATVCLLHLQTQSIKRLRLRSGISSFLLKCPWETINKMQICQHYLNVIYLSNWLHCGR